MKYVLGRYALVCFVGATMLASCAESTSFGRTAAPVVPSEVFHACPCVYVANDGGPNSITVYGSAFPGSDVRPIQTISGPHTKLDYPRAIALDDKRNIYVTNTASARVTIYRAGASGDVSPIAVLRGPNIAVPYGISVDALRNIYVLNYDSIKEYRPGARGSVTPIRSIEGEKTKLANNGGFATDTKGNFYVAHYFQTGSITTYAPKAKGDARPTRKVAGAATGLGESGSLAVDAGGYIYISQCCYTDGAVSVFGPLAKGNVPPARTIAGSYTQLDMPSGVALDSNENLYVTNTASNTITIYAPSANGNVPPIRVMSGPNTGLDYPSGIAIWPFN